MNPSVTIERQAGSLGAVVTGVDLAGPLDAALVSTLYDALLEHLVLCIRDQGAISPDQQIAFAARFGEIEPHPYVDPIEGHPEIIRIYDPNPLTETWHADFTYAKRPPALSFLLARTIPAYGGDTMFASGYRVFEDLSDGLKDTLRGLRAFHRGTELARSKGLGDEDIQAVHPVVSTHPDTGRELVNLNAVYVEHFDGWTAEESAPLLGFLCGRYARPEYSYRHRWHDGDLLIWDNRSVQHRVVGDTGGQPRDLHRVTVGSVRLR